MDWITLNNVAAIASIIALIPIVLSFILIAMMWNQRRTRLDWIRKNPGNNQAILIVDLLPNTDLESHVINFIGQNKEQFKGLLNDENYVDANRIFKLSSDNEIEPDLIDGLIDEFRKCVRKMNEAAVDEIHLFYGGPAIFASIIGAELSNRSRVLLYHKVKGGTGAEYYQLWGELSRPWM